MKRAKIKPTPRTKEIPPDIACRYRNGNFVGEAGKKERGERMGGGRRGHLRIMNIAVTESRHSSPLKVRSSLQPLPALHMTHARLFVPGSFIPLARRESDAARVKVRELRSDKAQARADRGRRVLVC